MSGSGKGDSSIQFIDPFSANREAARERRDSGTDIDRRPTSNPQGRRPAIAPRSASVMSSGVLDKARQRAGRTPPPPPPSASGK